MPHLGQNSGREGIARGKTPGAKGRKKEKLPLSRGGRR